MNKKDLTAIILAGGKGTRLKKLTKNIPKPLLKINDKKFLDYLLFDIARFGFKKIIIIAGYKGFKFKSYKGKKILNTQIELFIEKKFNGTLGAIDKVKNKIKSDFFIFNGDTIFNFNYLDLFNFSKINNSKTIYLSLRKVICKDLNRYTSYNFKKNDLYISKKTLNKKILISGGIIFCKKTILKYLKRNGDFEDYINKQKIFKNKITGKIYSNSFIDIGVPKDFNSSGLFLKKNLPKRAIFFDRDGVLNKHIDGKYITNKSQYKWIPGAKETIKYFNDNNFYVFVITNQAGIGKGLIKEKNYIEIENKMQKDLLNIGAHIDKIYFCPFHEKAKIKKYRKKSFDRKPNPGMILKCLKEFPVIKYGSVFVGDKITDKDAAKKAGINFLMFKNKNLHNFTKKNIKL